MKNPRFFREDEYIAPSKSQKTRVAWFDEFAKNIVKNPNIVAATQADHLADYISNIIDRKSKHATVADVVNEYQELTGLKAHLKNIYEQNIKCAQQDIDNPKFLPDVQPALKDKILSFIKNRIEAYKGFVTVLALQEEILNSFKGDGVKPQDIYEENFSKYIAHEIQKEQTKHPNDENANLLGKQWHDEAYEDEGANNDFFFNLEPKRN